MRPALAEPAAAGPRPCRPSQGLGRRRSTFAVCSVKDASPLLSHPHIHNTRHNEHGWRTGHELGWRTDFRDVYSQGQLVGTGSYGKVYVGMHHESGQVVAIKALPKVRGELSRDETLARITRETEMLTRLQGHSGIIQLLECFEDRERVQLVTEFCPGGDLYTFVERHGPLDEHSLAQVALEVLKIISSCHKLGILHGDIKPANFCMKSISAPFSHIQAIDFGCSQYVGHRRMEKRTGTRAFMAPEILARDYSYKVDVWALGVTLYWMYCKIFPVSDDDCAAGAGLGRATCHADSSIPTAYKFGPWLHMSAEGIDFIQGCLRQSEDERLSVDEALQHPWLSSLQRGRGPRQDVGRRPSEHNAVSKE